jgi:hypothetical protein
MKRNFLGLYTFLSCLLLIYQPCYSADTECYSQFNKNLSYALAQHLSRDEIGLSRLQPWGWVPKAIYDGERVNCLDWAKKSGGSTDDIMAKANKCNQIKSASIRVLNDLPCYCEFSDTPCQHFKNFGMSKCTEWLEHQLRNIKSGKVSYCKISLFRRFFREARFTGLENPIAGLQALIMYPKTNYSTIQDLSNNDSEFFAWCLKQLNDERYLSEDVIDSYLKMKELHPIYRMNDGVKQFQKALSSKGFKISIDGIWGDESIRAMQNYQRTAGLPKSHFPDQQTLWALGIDENDFYRKSVNKDILGLLESFQNSNKSYNHANSADAKSRAAD